MSQLKLKIAEKVEPVDLKGELRKRFLWYAISTIASRALPDVRDGLKPVHRRILYAMYRMRLRPGERYRKSAAVVGDVLGKYHPHGDQAAYQTMVRLAQTFSMRYPLVDGQGNFGSIDGDSAAAMRYTEARLTPIAMEILKEIDQDTVPFRPNYDSTLVEPVFLPSRVPNILVNGTSGIAVGMATNIPPHNLSEVVDALVAMISTPGLSTAQILKYIKGPDFPTGATMIANKTELRTLYEEGKGSVKLRGEWTLETKKRGKQQIVITSLPYAVNKSRLIEKIAQIIIDKKLPALDDVRDESDENIRIVIEIKGEVDIAKVIAYLFKYTDLEYSFAVNLTALDTRNTPRRMSLPEMLNIFLDFRQDTTRKRLEFELGKILERLHILKGLLKVLKNLDIAIAIIRKSKSRDEAREALKKKFSMDDIQANAVLDLRLASLVGIEVSKVKDEAKELDVRREEIESILKSPKKIMGAVKKDLLELKAEFGDKRKTRTIGEAAEEEEYSEADFISHEPCFVIVSRNGWVRRVKKEPNLSQLRFKESDSLLAVIPSDTSESVAFFTSLGKLYVTSIYQIQQTSGFGDPVQSMFKFGDGERLIAVSHAPHIASGKAPKGEFLAIMENGNGFRFSKDSVSETSRSGKRFANVKGDNAVFSVIPVEKPLLYIAASGGKGLLTKVADIPILAGAGAGVRVIKIKDDEWVVGAKNIGPKEKLRLIFDSGRDSILKAGEMEIGKRATTGRSYGGLKKKLMAVSYE